MTLTEYLQNAVTELRETARTFAENERLYGGETDEVSLALADHVEAMLKLHQPWETPAHYIGPDLIDADAGCEAGCDDSPCPSLLSVARLVSAITGSVPVPDAQQVIADAIDAYETPTTGGIQSAIVAALSAAGLLLGPDEVSVPREAVATLVSGAPGRASDYLEAARVLRARLNA